MSKLSSTAIEVCEYYYLSAPNGEKNKKNGINFAMYWNGDSSPGTFEAIPCHPNLAKQVAWMEYFSIDSL